MPTSKTSSPKQQQKQQPPQTNPSSKPPIVYTIAGSDSGGGAGIQADLHAIQSMRCHGCSAITCLTAQSSTGVTGVHTPPVDFLKLQLHTLHDDLVPSAIKIGMLGTKDIAMEVSTFIQSIKKRKDDCSNSSNEEEEVPTSPFVVLDPVMISTSGHKLIEDETKEMIIKSLFPYVDIVTPNKFEAEELLGGRKLNTPQDIEEGAKDILKMGVKAVLIKGGHTLLERQKGSSSSSSSDDNGLEDLPKGLNETLGFAQDYFLSSEGPLTPGKERICDGSRGVWLRAKR